MTQINSSYTGDAEVEPLTALSDSSKKTIEQALHQSQCNIQCSSPYILHAASTNNM